jgi:hypothetical protein
MTFRQWFTTHDIPYEKAVALTVGTDGTHLDTNSLLSVSVTSPIMVGGDMGTVYVQGAIPEDVVEYTEVQPHIYAANASPVLEVRERLAPVLSAADFVVVYRRGFMVPWLETQFADLSDGCEFLDVIMMAKLVESGQILPTDCPTITALSDRLMFATNYIQERGYSMDAVCERIIPGISGDSADAFLTGDSPKLECAVYRLYALWSALLDMGN